MLQFMSAGAVFWTISALAVSSPSEAPGVPGALANSGVVASEASVLEGTIEGRVVQAGTGRALAGAQIELVDLGLGTLAGADGRFSITSVPAGEVTVRVQILGFATSSQTVSLASGQTVTVDFQLSQQALALDEVVVTGTAGGTQRRAIGNVVDRLSASDINERAPVANVSQLIGGRSAGVTMLAGVGQVGAGQRIRIRGASSIGLDNDPIIYVDGVRMDSSPNRGPGQRGGANVSRLNDLDPETIESIEIIKGPAAATLYGTEASNGVIQIITKRGSTASPALDVTVRSGANWLWDPAGRQGLSWARDSNSGELISFNAYEYERDFGEGDLFTYGGLQSYNASLRGGTDAIRYYITGSWHDETGAVDWNWDKRGSGRANLDIVPTDQISIRTSMGYTEGRRRLAQGALAIDPFSNLYWATPARIDQSRGFFWAPPEELRKVEDRADIDRFTGSFEIRHTPFDWFVHRMVAGVDSNQELYSRLFPRQPEGSNHFFGGQGLGDKSVTRAQRRFVTLDYGASATFGLTDELQGVTSVGFQYYRARDLTIGATGTEFPAIPITTVTGGANRNASESLEENATVGVYLQQQMEWRNRVFLTGAVRFDDNSAFGQEFDAAVYPKLSATWVVHEEPFWDLDWVSQFRLRAAWGAAGQQPGTFDASRLYTPQIGFNDEPSLIPNAFGNPELEPERGEEIELGFDADFMDGRVSLVYTRFDRWTRNAIVSRGIPRSLGFPGGQVVNLGLVRGWGNEVALDLQLMESPRFTWDLGIQLANFENRIEDLGDEGVIGSGEIQQRVGFSISDRYMRRVVSAEIDEAGNLLSALCDGGTGRDGVEPGGPAVPCDEAPLVWWGHTQPTWDIGVTNDWSFGPFSLYARVDASGGHYQLDSSGPAAITSVGVTRLSLTRDDPLVQAYRTVGRNPMGTYKAGFARLREVSLSYSMPPSLAQRIGAQRGSISVAGRNLAMLWTAQEGWNTPRSGQIFPEVGDGRLWDPETRGSANLSTGFQSVMPPLANAVVTVRLGF